MRLFSLISSYISPAVVTVERRVSAVMKGLLTKLLPAASSILAPHTHWAKKGPTDDSLMPFVKCFWKTGRFWDNFFTVSETRSYLQIRPYKIQFNDLIQIINQNHIDDVHISLHLNPLEWWRESHPVFNSIEGHTLVPKASSGKLFFGWMNKTWYSIKQMLVKAVRLLVCDWDKLWHSILWLRQLLFSESGLK